VKFMPVISEWDRLYIGKYNEHTFYLLSSFTNRLPEENKSTTR
jgi:hypothetical protein